jgi:hypothetical protein
MTNIAEESYIFANAIDFRCDEGFVRRDGASIDFSLLSRPLSLALDFFSLLF